jgi:hypothetical protein
VRVSAKRILHVVRRHWAIENELHWVLDVAMDEDHNRVHKDQAPENMAVLRHMALNLLTRACGTAQANKRRLQKVVFMPSNFKPLGIMIISASY